MAIFSQCFCKKEAFIYLNLGNSCPSALVDGWDIKTAFTRCRHTLKTVKNVTVAKFELAFTRCRNNLKTVGNLMVKNSLQGFDAEETYIHPRNRSVSFQKRCKMFCFHHF